MTTPGVLPDNIASKIRTADSAGKIIIEFINKSQSMYFFGNLVVLITEVYKYIERRTQKYVHKRITKERLNELKEDAKNYPNRFFAIVFDEAHYRYDIDLIYAICFWKNESMNL